MADLFKCKDEMPPKDNSPDVVRSALTMAEAKREINMSGSVGTTEKDVKNIERPRFGHAT